MLTFVLFAIVRLLRFVACCPPPTSCSARHSDIKVIISRCHIVIMIIYVKKWLKAAASLVYSDVHEELKDVHAWIKRENMILEKSTRNRLQFATTGHAKNTNIPSVDRIFCE